MLRDFVNQLEYANLSSLHYRLGSRLSLETERSGKLIAKIKCSGYMDEVTSVSPNGAGEEAARAHIRAWVQNKTVTLLSLHLADAMLSPLFEGYLEGRFQEVLSFMSAAKPDYGTAFKIAQKLACALDPTTEDKSCRARVQSFLNRNAYSSRAQMAAAIAVAEVNEDALRAVDGASSTTARMTVTDESGAPVAAGTPMVYRRNANGTMTMRPARSGEVPVGVTAYQFAGAGQEPVNVYIDPSGAMAPNVTAQDIAEAAGFRMENLTDPQRDLIQSLRAVGTSAEKMAETLHMLFGESPAIRRVTATQVVAPAQVEPAHTQGAVSRHRRNIVIEDNVDEP